MESCFFSLDVAAASVDVKGLFVLGAAEKLKLASYTTAVNICGGIMQNVGLAHTLEANMRMGRRLYYNLMFDTVRGGLGRFEPPDTIIIDPEKVNRESYVTVLRHEIGHLKLYNRIFFLRAWHYKWFTAAWLAFWLAAAAAFPVWVGLTAYLPYAAVWWIELYLTAKDGCAAALKSYLLQYFVAYASYASAHYAVTHLTQQILTFLGGGLC